MLSRSQQDALIAAMDRIIPADDYPSASQAGVMDYFAFQFAGDLAHTLPLYMLGLDTLDIEAGFILTGARFGDLSTDQQDELLARLELGGPVKANWPIDPAEFFTMVCERTIEGFYADNKHNHGNHGHVSWKMIGFADRSGLEAGAE